MGLSSIKMVSKNKLMLNNIKIKTPKYFKSTHSTLSSKEIKEIDNLEIINEIKELNRINLIIEDTKLPNRNIVLFGLGGSSLSLKTIVESLNYKGDLFIVDNLDGQTFNDVFNGIKIKSSVFVFVSKSGETFEIIKLLKETIKKIKKNNLQLKSSLLFITENNNGYLNKFGIKEKIPTFYINQNIGGRFSALSKSTLIPCELLDIKWKKIISGAIKTYKILVSNKFQTIDLLANFHYKNLQKNKVNSGLICYKDNLNCFGEWFMQLWGESLGKTTKNGKETGLTPTKYIGPKDQHSQMQLILEGSKDKTLMVISVKKNKNSNNILNNSVMEEKEATIKALKIKKIPYVELELESLNEETLGSLFIIFHLLTIRLAKKMKVNPFDQPAVELIKRNLKP